MVNITYNYSKPFTLELIMKALEDVCGVEKRIDEDGNEVYYPKDNAKA